MGASHTPPSFTDPDSLDIRRANQHHLAFGHGRHFCVGAQLARLEAHLAFDALLQQTSDISLNSVSFDDLAYQDNFNVRRVKQLPLAAIDVQGDAGGALLGGVCEAPADWRTGVGGFSTDLWLLTSDF